MSEYLDSTANRVSDGVTARGADVNNVIDAVSTGFDLLPSVANTKRGTINYGSDTGTANTYLVALPHTPSGYVDGLLVSFKAVNANTGASTINVNSLGVKSLRSQSGAALVDGDVPANKIVTARYNTTSGYMEIQSVTAGNAANIATVAGIAANVTTVAGISADVTTVAGISTDVTDVKNIAADVTAVAAIDTAVSAVAADATDIGVVAAADAAIGTVSTNIANVNTVGGISTNVTTVAGIQANVTTVAGISTNVTTVAGISANVATVAGVSSDVTAVAAQAIGWTFSTTTTMADPGSGIMRFNNATPASVTAIALDDLNSAAQDVSAFVITWDDSTATIKGTLTLRQGTSFAMYSVTGLTDNVGWTQLAVTYVTGSGSFANSTLAFASFQRTGNDGSIASMTIAQLNSAVSDADLAILGANDLTGGEQFLKETRDTVYPITDGAAFEIDPVNGNIQVVTLGASRTPAATNFEAGQCVLLGIDDGTAYTITWTAVAVTWVKVGGTASAPTLATSGYTWVLLWKVGSTIYGCEVGKP